MAELLAALMALTGSVFLLLAAVALFRMPDVFGRLSATSKAVTLGASLVLLGAAVALQEAGLSARAGAAVAFLLLTSPITAHVLGRAAWRTGEELHVEHQDAFETAPERGGD